MSEIQLKKQSDATTALPDADYKSLFYSTTSNSFAYKDEVNAVFPLLDTADARLSTTNLIMVKQNPGIGEFSSVAAAIASITGNTASNRFLVLIGPGEYSEPLITVPEYVSVAGHSIQSTVIVPDAANHHVFKVSALFSEISFLTINNAGSGYAGVFIDNCGNFAQLHKVSFNECHTNILVDASTADAYLYAEYVDFNGDYVYGLKVQSSNGFIANVNSENYYQFPSTINTLYHNYVTGNTSELSVQTAGFVGFGTETCTLVTGGGLFRMNAAYVDNCDIGVQAAASSTLAISAVDFKDCVLAVTDDSGASNININVSSSQFINCTTNIDIVDVTTTGNFIGYTSILKTSIIAGAAFFVANKDTNIIKVAKTGGDFSSIKDAVDYAITLSPTITNQYIIDCGPGVYYEDKITGYEWISVISDQATIIANDPTDSIFLGADGFTLQGFLLQGVTTAGKAAIYFSSTGNEIGQVLTLRDLSFVNCSVCVELVGATTYPTTIYMQACTMQTQITTGFKVTGTATGLAQLVINGFAYQAVGAPLVTKCFDVSGANASVSLVGCLFKGAGPAGTWLEIYNGALCRIVSTLIFGWAKGLYCPNTGTGPQLRIEVLGAESCTQDIDIVHTGATGFIKGSYDRTKVSINSTASATLAVTYTDTTNRGMISAGPLYLGSESAELVDTLDLIESSPAMGLMSGGVLSAGSGFVVNVASGFGYLASGTIPTNQLKRISWSATTITLSANVDVYIYYNSSGTLTSNAAYPDLKSNILLGRVATNGSAIEVIDLNKFSNLHPTNDLGNWIRDVFSTTFVASGAVVSENASPRKLDISAGEIYVGLNKIAPASGTAFTWTKVIRDGGGSYTLTASQDTVPNDKYDNNSGTEATVAASQFARHWLYQSGEGSLLKRYLVLSQTTYASLVLAQAGSAPTVPTYFRDGLIRVASIITQQGVSLASEIRDERPRPASSAAGSTAVSDHGALSGLSDDDHTLYTKADGTRAFTGNIDIGGNQITNVGNVDGVDVSAHASRHGFTGADALSPALLANITDISDSTGAAGTNNTLIPRADHQHAHGNRGGGSLHAAATTSVAGFLSSTDKTKLDALPTRYTYTTTGTQASTSTTYAAVTELTSVSLATGNYRFIFTGLTRTSATTTGFGLRLGAGTATVTTCYGLWHLGLGPNGVDATYIYHQLTSTTNVTSTSIQTANTDFVSTGVGFFTVTVAGTVSVQIRTETGGNAATINIGSNFIIESVT